jgi:hypothetical protein
MARRDPDKFPTYWRQWFGKLAIRVLPIDLHYGKPDVVFITHCDSRGLLRGEVINSPENLFVSPKRLVPYSPGVFAALHNLYILREARATVAHKSKLMARGHG